MRLTHVETLLPGDLQKLLEQRTYRSRALRVNPEPPARIDAVAGLVGVTPRAHKQEKIALVLLAQQILARRFHILRGTAQQEIPPLRERRHQRHRPHAAALLRREQHARITRMHRKPQHSPAEFGDRPLFSSQCAQIRQQQFRALQGLCLGLFQPRKTKHIVDAAGLERQHDLGKIEPLHLGQLLQRPGAVLPLRPEPHADSRRRAAGAARALVGARRGDFFDEQRVDPAVRIEARHPREPAIDHGRHPVDGERGLRDVGRDDDLARLRPGHRAVLLIRRQFPVQREAHEIPQPAPALNRLQRAVDLISARHEHEHVALREPRYAFTLARRHVPHRFQVEVRRPLEILDRHRKAPPLRHEQLAWCQVGFQHPGIERRRHHDDLQVGSRRLLDLHRPRQRNISVKVTLVKLVEHERVDAAQHCIKRHLPEQNPLGHKPHARLRRHP